MILVTVLRNVLGDDIDTEINTGVGTATLVFENATDTAVATINLQNPAFNTAAAGVITLNGVTLSDTSAAGGTVAQVSIFDRDGTKQLEMTCGTGAQEIVISSTAVAATDQVDLTALTITVPAS